MVHAAAVVIGLIVGSFVYVAWRRAPFGLTTIVVLVASFFVLEIDVRVDPLDWLTSWTSLVFYNCPTGPGSSLFCLLNGPSPPWTAFTSMYLHAGLLHLVFNLFALLLLANALEDRIGTARFAMLWVVTGLIATAGFALVRYATPYALVGASGAISGLFGAFARLYPRERVRFVVLVIPLPPLPVLPVAVGYVAVSSLLGIAGVLGSIAWEAHAVGLFAGFLLAPAVMRWDVRGGRGRPLDPAGLRDLATTPALLTLLADIERETVPEVQQAWVGRFAELAGCPRCGKPLSLSRRSLISECGWRRHL